MLLTFFNKRLDLVSLFDILNWTCLSNKLIELFIKIGITIICSRFQCLQLGVHQCLFPVVVFNIGCSHALRPHWNVIVNVGALPNLFLVNSHDLICPCGCSKLSSSSVIWAKRHASIVIVLFLLFLFVVLPWINISSPILDSISTGGCLLAVRTAFLLFDSAMDCARRANGPLYRTSDQSYCTGHRFSYNSDYTLAYTNDCTFSSRLTSTKIWLIYNSCDSFSDTFYESKPSIAEARDYVLWVLVFEIFLIFWW